MTDHVQHEADAEHFVPAGFGPPPPVIHVIPVAEDQRLMLHAELDEILNARGQQIVQTLLLVLGQFRPGI